MSEAGMRNFAEVLRDEMVMADRIRGILQDAPKTIPEIALQLNRPQHEVTCWVMAMWRYGKIVETGKANAEGYFHYTLKK